MKHMDKIRVAVLYGGRSAEHEVSLRSAANVIRYLDSERFEVIPIGIDKQGNWLLGQDIFKHSLTQNEVKCLSHESSTWFTPEWVGTSVVEQAPKSTNDAKPSAKFDVVFPITHGTNCEDGSLQGLLELADLPYVGCRILASAIGMDKDVSKRLAQNANILVGPFFVIKQHEWQTKREQVFARVEKELGFPVFVKPANTGSSIGISKAKSKAQFIEAVELAFHYDKKVLIEKALNIVELEIAVLENLTPGAEPIVSVVGEVRPSHEFYSYEAKYIDDNGAKLLIPAPDIDANTLKKAQQIAANIFTVLECEGMARVDLFYDKANGEIYFNEINTIPGFTKVSMYPILMEASGVQYTQLLSHLIQLAINKHKDKSKLIRNFIE